MLSESSSSCHVIYNESGIPCIVNEDDTRKVERKGQSKIEISSKIVIEQERMEQENTMYECPLILIENQ